MEAVTSEARRCMKEEIAVKEAVANILQTLNLYLAENE